MEVRVSVSSLFLVSPFFPMMYLEAESARVSLTQWHWATLHHVCPNLDSLCQRDVHTQLHVQDHIQAQGWFLGQWWAVAHNWFKLKQVGRFATALATTSCHSLSISWVISFPIILAEEEIRALFLLFALLKVVICQHPNTQWTTFPFLYFS